MLSLADLDAGSLGGWDIFICNLLQWLDNLLQRGRERRQPIRFVGYAKRRGCVFVL
jgi:hypothetical protein